MHQSNKALEVSADDAVRFSILFPTVKGVLSSAKLTKLATSIFFTIRKSVPRNSKKEWA